MKQLQMKIVEENNLNTYSIIDSEIRIYNPSKSLINYCIKLMMVKNPQYEFYRRINKLKFAELNHVPEKIQCFKFDPISQVLTIPFGMLKNLWGILKKYPYTINFNHTEDISIKDIEPLKTPRDYQIKAVDSILEGKGGILVSPCGSGKTFMGQMIVQKIGKKFLWLTHKKDLLDQTYDAFKENFPEIKLGKFDSNKKIFGEDGTIATVQSLINVNPDIYANEFEVVICDESVHTIGSVKNVSAFSQILNSIKARYKFGLTATPSRSDDLIKTMYMYLGCNKQGELKPYYVVPSSVVKTVESIHLRHDLETISDEKKYTTYIKRTGKDGKEKKVPLIDYGKLIDYLISIDSRFEQISNNVLMNSLDNRKQVILCSRLEEIDKYYDILSKHLKVKKINSKTKAKERNEILNHPENWNVLIATYSLLKEGTNIPSLDTLHLATPIVAKNNIIQCAGRIERVYTGKKQPVIFDYVDYNIDYLKIAFFRREKSLKERYKKIEEAN